ncbi:MAG: metallophosphoesterase [Alphaproteobacteria bacterium]|nr:MAG: metallophosphoesterase [Alphaproteobacteria bacterium]
MAVSTTFLHITDAHFSGDGTPFSRDDHKVVIEGIPSHTRETVFDHSFGRLADRLEAEGTRLDGLIFSGDAQVGGTEGGHRILFDMLLKHFARVGISPLNIVAVPGNHDVDRDYPPSAAGRYRQFAEVWRNEGCVVPWLDSDDEPGGTRHFLTDEDSSWAVFAINSSNWCHAASVLPPPLGEVWSRLPELAAPGNPKVAAKIRDQLDRLARFDMARLSDKQLERFTQEVERSPKPSRGPQLRIAVLHHHLQAPSMSEEIKPFANISNLEQVRSALRDRGIDIVIHGHKHEAAVLQERFQAADGTPGRPLMTISGATIEQGREEDAMRLITLSGLPYNAQVRIEAVGLSRRAWTLHRGESSRGACGRTCRLRASRQLYTATISTRSTPLPPRRRKARQPTAYSSCTLTSRRKGHAFPCPATTRSADRCTERIANVGSTSWWIGGNATGRVSNTGCRSSMADACAATAASSTR